MFDFKRMLAAILALLGSAASAQPPQTAPSSVFTDLRAMALARKPADIGLSANDYADKPWGLLMEARLHGGASYSLVVIADGTVSLYLSTGGGFIGAGADESVRRAATAMLGMSARFQAFATPSLSTPLPAEGQAVFYLLTSKGTLRYGAPQRSLVQGQDRFSDLFNAGQLVIAAIRQTQTSGAAGRR